MTDLRPIGDELVKRLPQSAVDDVVDYLTDNSEARSVDSLTPREFLDRYMKWNGLVGWADNVVLLMELMGWELKQPTARITSDEDRTVHDPKDAVEPLAPTSKKPLYKESL